MSQRFIIIEQKNIKKLLKNFSLFFLFGFCFIFSANAKADFSKCRDKEFQNKVKQVAKEEGVDSNELLSIMAHESRCNYFVIAWNLPGAPQTAKNKFFESFEEAISFTEELIATKKYRVDVGIGQINYEANIKRNNWILEEVLDPKTALNRVAFILRERGWKNYHSGNTLLARRWQKLALIALDRVRLTSEERVEKKSSYLQILKSTSLNRKQNSLLVFGIQGVQIHPLAVRSEEPAWVIYSKP